MSGLELKHFECRSHILVKIWTGYWFLKSGPFRRNLTRVIDYGREHKIEQNFVEDTNIGQENRRPNCLIYLALNKSNSKQLLGQDSAECTSQNLGC